MSGKTKLQGKKVHTTLNGVKRLIVAEVVKHIRSRDQNYKGPTRDALALYFEGTMGIGKSQATQQAVKLLSEIFNEEFGLIDIRLAGMTGSDIQGIPVPVKAKDLYGRQVQMSPEEAEEVMLKWIKDTLLPGISKTCKSKGLLFLDELNQVEDNSVKSLLYQLILDKKINDYSIPDGWFIVAAGNREEDGGVFNRLPAPVRDRMMIVEVDLNKQEWLDLYARPYKVHPSVIAFIEGKPDTYLHTYDPELERDGDEECNNYVFATPRSWVMSSDEIFAYEDPFLNPQIADYGPTVQESDLRTQLGGLLGSDVGQQFYQFYLQTRDVDVEKICSISWKDGKPNKSIKCEEEQLMYLAELAAYPTDETIEKSIKILMYLTQRGTTSTNISIILNSYTTNQNEALCNFCIDNNCNGLIAQLEEVSAKFKAIAGQ